MMRLHLDFAPMRAQLLKQAETLPEQLATRLRPIAEEMVDYAKANHGWQNQSGDAEAGLFGDAEELTDGLVWLFLSHGLDVDYAGTLESIGGGRFGVLRPTFDLFLPRIRESLRGLL